MAARPAAQPPGPEPAPVRSMTGFGAGACGNERYEVRVEVRGVNHRHLVWKSGLPAGLQSAEQEVDALIRRYVTRGSLTFSLSHEARHESPRVRFDGELAAAYLAELEQLVARLGLAAKPSPDFLLGLPGVVEPVPAESIAEELREVFLGALEAALRELVESREREGAAVARQLQAHTVELESLIEEIDERWPRVIDEYRSRLEKRVREFLAERGHTLEEVDLLREVTVFAERSDVAEETARFRTHLAEIRRLVATGGSVGRALEFLIQEMVREANTIGAKSSDAGLSHRVVSLKTTLDRIKEQAQNLE